MQLSASKTIIKRPHETKGGRYPLPGCSFFLIPLIPDILLNPCKLRVSLFLSICLSTSFLQFDQRASWEKCVFRLTQQQETERKATRDKVRVFILLHTHAMLVEPWPSTADIHHDMLPPPVCPSARLMQWSTSMNYTWKNVCIWAPAHVCLRS